MSFTPKCSLITRGGQPSPTPSSWQSPARTSAAVLHFLHRGMGLCSVCLAERLLTSRQSVLGSYCDKATTNIDAAGSVCASPMWIIRTGVVYLCESVHFPLETSFTESSKVPAYLSVEAHPLSTVARTGHCLCFISVSGFVLVMFPRGLVPCFLMLRWAVSWTCLPLSGCSDVSVQVSCPTLLLQVTRLLTGEL